MNTKKHTIDRIKKTHKILEIYEQKNESEKKLLRKSKSSIKKMKFTVNLRKKKLMIKNQHQKKIQFLNFPSILILLID